MKNDSFINWIGVFLNFVFFWRPVEWGPFDEVDFGVIISEFIKNTISTLNSRNVALNKSNFDGWEIWVVSIE